MLFQNPDTVVALKCFINLIVNGKRQDLSLQDFAVAYSDIRTELNKLSSTSHPNIVTFLGLCVISFSFLLEWAPKGNLANIAKEYKLADVWICPDALAITVYQVCVCVSFSLGEFYTHKCELDTKKVRTTTFVIYNIFFVKLESFVNKRNLQYQKILLKRDLS